MISAFYVEVWISGRWPPCALQLSTAWDHTNPLPRENPQAHDPSYFLNSSVSHATVAVVFGSSGTGGGFGYLFWCGLIQNCFWTHLDFGNLVLLLLLTLNFLLFTFIFLETLKFWAAFPRQEPGLNCKGNKVNKGSDLCFKFKAHSTEPAKQKLWVSIPSLFMANCTCTQFGLSSGVQKDSGTFHCEIWSPHPTLLTTLKCKPTKLN